MKTKHLPLAILGILPLLSTPLSVRADEGEEIDWVMMTPAPRYQSQAAGSLPSVAEDKVVEFDAEKPFEGFPNALSPEEAAKANVGDFVAVTGKILAVSPSRSDRMPTTIEVSKDPSLSIIFYPQVGNHVLENGVVPSVGQMVTARGTLAMFRDKLQLNVGGSADIFFQGTERTPQSALNALAGQAPEITKGVIYYAHESLESVSGAAELGDKVDSSVIIAGYVDSFRESDQDNRPNVLTLQDPTGSIDVVFWNSMKGSLSSDMFQRGTPLIVKGKVNVYRDKLQLQPEEASDMMKIDGPQFKAQVAKLTGN